MVAKQIEILDNIYPKLDNYARTLITIIFTHRKSSAIIKEIPNKIAS
jgi:hypothetical protein